jgi:flavin reductase (DIM6/NTAB) family NADH-FMN oxidoreductase RutF
LKAVQLDMRTLNPVTRYKILTSTITPRPIAWITTLARDGTPNCAPYSFFNAVGDDPPLLVLGLIKHPVSGLVKDTARNILETGEFVVNLVCEADALKMNESSVDAPPEVDELVYAGIETTPSVAVKPPRIATSPVSFECRKYAAMDIGKQTVVLGEILVAHVKDEFVSDPERHYVDTPAMKLIGRTHGSGWYVRNSDSLQIQRPKLDPVRAGLEPPED